MPSPADAASKVSVIVRARDESASIGRCLELLRGQHRYGDSLELILVDSGSVDDTPAIARHFGARVIGIDPAEFSFGGSLNLGAAKASGEILISLSAHAFLPDEGWLARLLAPFLDARVACACGERYLPDGSRLERPIAQDLRLARRDLEWGYSNAAGAFRASLWRQRAFREDLPGCEDLDWSFHWLAQGMVCWIDPALAVEHDHTHDPVLSIYRRARREAEGLAMALELAPYGFAELLVQWWSDLRFYRSAAKARFSHRRAARLLGAYAGRRRASRGRLEPERDPTLTPP